MSSNPISLMIDLERCTGCKSCEAACKQSNALGPHVYRNRVMWFSDAHAADAATTAPALLDFLTVTCQQCERPACLRACPVAPKAISKDPDTGVVAINEDRCTGCGECAMACPYGAIGYNAEDHHAVKCDLCAHRRDQGSGPACAAVCPTRAITFGTRDEHLQQVVISGRQVLDNDHFLQKPATVYLKRRADQGLTVSEHSQRHQYQHIPVLMNDDKVRNNLYGTATSNTYNKAAREQTDTHKADVIPGGCNICFNGCPVKYEMKNGKIVNLYGNDDDPIFEGRICPKSQMTLQMYQNPERLTQPLKRVGKRGEGKFIEISWDQALDEIAAKLQQVRDQYGADTLAIQSGSRTGALNLMGTIPLFAGLWGTANVATTEPFCDLSKVVALEMTQGSTMQGNVYTPDDMGSAELYVYIGDNQAETRPVNFGLINHWRLQNGAKMVVADPRMTATASKADQWLPIRPGTDMALGLALIHYILSHDLQDADFCRDDIEGFETWRDFILQQGYSPEWAEPVTDIPAQTIQKLAQDIAQADGCMIYLSRGINQHTNATQTNRTFMFLAAISGNWGRPGGGFFNVSAEPDWHKPTIPTERKPATRPAISKNPAAWVDAMLGQDEYPIRALITGNNPLGQWPDQNKARRAVANLDLVVHLELFRNATSDYADFVLPMASGIEKGGTTRFAEDRRVVWFDKLVDPPGEAKSDHWFWIELGKRFGFDDILKEGYKDPRILWDDVVSAATPALRGITTEKLLQQPSRWLRFPLTDDNESDTLYQKGSSAFAVSDDRRFPTPSGKLEFYNASIQARFTEVGMSALPEFYAEADSLTPLPYIKHADKKQVSPFFPIQSYAAAGQISTEPQATDTKYDTELVTGRPPAPHFHSWTHYFWQAQEMWPELFCQIHPHKAEKLGIKDGDKVRVTTHNGKITARAWRHAGIRKSAIFIPIGWDEQQPYHPTASVNHLTALTLDPISQQANLKVHRCRVEKV